MRRALVGLLIALLAWPALAQEITSTPPSAGNLPAQPSTGTAAAGALGEFASAQNDASSCSGATATNATPTVIGSCTNTFQARCVGAYTCVFAVYLSALTSGTGLAISTLYYVCTSDASMSTTGFHLADSAAHCLSNTFLATSASGSGITLVAAAYMASATPTIIEEINLGAGDWTCSSGINTTGVASTAPTVMQVGTNTGLSFTNYDGATTRLLLVFSAGTPNDELITGPKRFGLGTTTTVNTLFTETFSGGITNPTVGGQLSCRRAG